MGELGLDFQNGESKGYKGQNIKITHYENKESLNLDDITEKDL